MVLRRMYVNVREHSSQPEISENKSRLRSVLYLWFCVGALRQTVSCASISENFLKLSDGYDPVY